MDYQQAIDYISSFGRFGSRPGLERMEWLLQQLGHPEQQLRFVHIAGTNGKGSTTAFVHGILQAAGYRVGMYTSPYLEAFTNRIGANGQDIDQQQLAGLVTRLRPLFEQVNSGPLGPITQFEVTTALALAYYQESQVDYVAWEVGLGGRLDATNVVTPEVSVITNIGLDHTEVLGDSLAKIALEKAGIIKQGIPLVTAVEEDEPWRVIDDQAQQLQAPVWRLGRDFSYQRGTFDLEKQQFNYRDSLGEMPDLGIPLIGEHQCRNAATAVAAVRRLQQAGVAIKPEAYYQGLAQARWPGRLEVMSREPFIIVDGAHNPHGAKALRRALFDYFQGRRIVMVLGILKDKERKEMFSHLLPLATRVIFTAPQYGRATDPALLLQDAAQYRLPAVTTTDVPGAINLALAELRPDEMLLIAGSLYTVAEARDHLRKIIDRNYW
jgi:dihydrofolate synthase/folylpolyglutamate synthase